MKELKANKPIINTHFPISKRLPTKRWIIAQARPEKHRVDQNSCTEAAYHRVIDAVKTHFENRQDRGITRYAQLHYTNILLYAIL